MPAAPAPGEELPLPIMNGGLKITPLPGQVQEVVPSLLILRISRKIHLRISQSNPNKK